jgi:hypothetical protein
MKIKIIRKPDDPICPRASIGGTPEIGYYLAYRGDIAAVQEAIWQVFLKLCNDRQQGIEHPIEPEG